MEPWNEEDLAARLGRCETSGRLEGLEIEYWVGGGLPPPYYRSDQFRWLTVDGADTLELARPKFDEAYNPYPVEKFQLPAKPEDVQAVARHLREARVFRDTHPEERDPRVADILRVEVLVTEGERQAKRVYYAGPPAPLEALGDEVARLAAIVVVQGKRGLFHLGKPIQE